MMNRHEALGKVMRFISGLTDSTVLGLAEAIDEDKEDVTSVISSCFDNNAKRCEDFCPECGAGGGNSEDIEWGSLESDSQPYRPKNECGKCGCLFTEYYIYAGTEIKELPKDENLERLKSRTNDEGSLDDSKS
jgi:NAD-dependent dihydropyrimidine dehydrogenase PreA subunit